MIFVWIFRGLGPLFPLFLGLVADLRQVTLRLRWDNWGFYVFLHQTLQDTGLKTIPGLFGDFVVGVWGLRFALVLMSLSVATLLSCYWSMVNISLGLN